uniref:Uncharacterized protein n=1 Tax=Arundo donax TaxID=35708 RepID=A0A0A9CF49_ARUDO
MENGRSKLTNSVIRFKWLIRHVLVCGVSMSWLAVHFIACLLLCSFIYHTY